MRLDISCESSARQRIHRKHQALFSLEDKSKINVPSAASLLGSLRFKAQKINEQTTQFSIANVQNNVLSHLNHIQRA